MTGKRGECDEKKRKLSLRKKQQQRTNNSGDYLNEKLKIQTQTTNLR